LSKDIYHIASDYFNGRISEADRENLHAWLDQSPDHRQVFAELEKVWKLTGKLRQMEEPDVNHEWLRFVENRDQSPAIRWPETSKKRTWSITPLRIAAVLIPALLLIASVFFFFHKPDASNKDCIVVTTGNNKIKQILPDGSEVWINTNSALSYPKKFNKKERLVKLSGEAFFNVVKNKGRFVVNTSNSHVTVMGTEFNVRAYEAEHLTEVQVQEGKVLFSAQNRHDISVALEAGERGVLRENASLIKKEMITNSNSFAWMTQKFHFDNTPVRSIGTDISRYFNKTVVVAPAIGDCLFTGSFDRPDINELLKIITTSLGCDYRVRNDTIYIEGDGCRN
jgi:transmembrane sensor